MGHLFRDAAELDYDNVPEPGPGIKEIIDFEKRKEFYSKWPLLDKVLDILREQPRDLETIGWGVYQAFGDQLDMRTILECLEKLEKQGRATRCESKMPGMPTGNWWKLGTMSTTAKCRQG